MEQTKPETGTVIDVIGEKAKVRIDKSSACKECGKAQAGICGKSGEGMEMEARNSLNASVGDRVTLDLETRVHVSAYFLIFISPVLALFLFAYVGHELTHFTEFQGLDVILGIAGLSVAIVFSLLKLKKLDKTAEMEISRIVHESTESDVTVC